MSDTAHRPQGRDEDPVERLDQAETRLDQAERRVAEFGREDLEELADAYRRFTDLIERYEEKVLPDGGDYETNIQFQSEIADLSSDFSDDMLLYETFEECDEHLQQKWFNESHFEYVREQLEPVADLVERLDEHDAALDHYREARRDIRHRIRSLDEEIADLERLSRLGEADLDAPTERLREPIEAYNDAIAEAFEAFVTEEPAREVIAVLETMTAYPLVPFRAPPDKLADYLHAEPPGTEPVPTLLEYAEYSRSKLDHYVADPDRLKHVVGSHRTYLSGLDADPLQVSWPPPSAAHLRWRCQELTAAVNRIAPPVVEQLRTVAALPRDHDYERLRDSARAKAELSAAERERLAGRNIEAELDQARSEHDRLATALESYPER
jgi:hypothetical protein